MIGSFTVEGGHNWAHLMHWYALFEGVEIIKTLYLHGFDSLCRGPLCFLSF